MKRAAIILIAWSMLAAIAVAQSEMPKPGPEHKKLEVFAGSWTLDGDFKPGPMGSGGKMTETEKCDWMDGNFFLVCHADAKTSMGDASAFSIMGYSSDNKTYTYREFNSMGEFMESKGSLDGDTWTWTGDDKMNGTVVKGRFTMKMVSPTAYNFTYEMSQDGTKWTLVMDGKASKSK
jgi:hypothetical protein